MAVSLLHLYQKTVIIKLMIEHSLSILDKTSEVLGRNRVRAGLALASLATSGAMLSMAYHDGPVEASDSSIAWATTPIVNNLEALQATPGVVEATTVIDLMAVTGLVIGAMRRPEDE
jgi:hypothetical protein